jgi:hypothetical protein
MKPLIIFLFAALLLPLSAQAQYNYTTNSGTITITGYSGPGGTVTIPDTINGYPVTSLADDAFWYNNNLTNLIVGGNVLNIGANTFAFSTNLVSVIIPNSVTNIGGGAFQNCTNMTSITLGTGLRSVGGSAFAFDAGLVGLYFQGNAPTFVALTSVFYAVHGATIYYNTGTTGWAAAYDALSTATIQSQYQYSSDGTSITITNYIGSGVIVAIPAAIIGFPVTSIGYEAFFNKYNLNNIIFPSSLISIGGEAFLDSFSLTSAIIPASVTNIDAGVFASCTSLTNIIVSPQNPAYRSVNGVLFNQNQTLLIQFPAGGGGAYTIPPSVTSIGDYAFGACAGLTSIVIPANVVNIGDYTFADCTNLPNVAIPNGVTNIGEAAFADCVRLTSVIIPATVNSIGDYAFGFCNGLINITVSPQNQAYRSVNGVLFNKSQTTLIQFPAGVGGT